MRQACRIQRAGECGGVSGALDEVVEEALGAVARVVHDLPAEETVLRRDIAFDVDEAQDPARVRMGQHQRRQPAHRVADEVEAADAVGLQHRFSSRHEEGNGELRQITTVRLAAARRIPGQERTAVEGRVMHDVSVVFLSGTKPVQEDDRLQRAAAAYRRQVDGHPVDLKPHDVTVEPPLRHVAGSIGIQVCWRQQCDRELGRGSPPRPARRGGYAQQIPTRG